MRLPGLVPLLICFEFVAVAAACVTAAVGLGGYLRFSCSSTFFSLLPRVPWSAVPSLTVSTGYGGNERR